MMSQVKIVALDATGRVIKQLPALYPSLALAIRAADLHAEACDARLHYVIVGAIND